MDVNKKEPPLITVIVPVYNIENYISKCLDSIITQSYKNIEVILVDDGSTDMSSSICDKYCNLDGRITVFHKNNGGLVSARKYGMEHASGEYLLNVDGDDYIKPDMIGKMYKRLIENNADVVQCGFECDDGKLYRYDDCKMELNNTERAILVEEWLAEKPRFDSQIFTKLGKADIMIKAYLKVPNKCSYGEDCVFYSELLKSIHSISIMKDVFYCYRIRKGSVSHPNNYFIDKLIETDYFFPILYENLKSYCGNDSIGLLEKWISKEKMRLLKNYMKKKWNYTLPIYKIDCIEQLRGHKVAVYGAGTYGVDIIIQLSVYADIQITYWVDLNAHDYNYSFRKVHYPEALNDGNWDYLIIALHDKAVSEDIADRIGHELCVEANRIIWDYERLKV